MIKDILQALCGQLDGRLHESLGSLGAVVVVSALCWAVGCQDLAHTARGLQGPPGELTDTPIPGLTVTTRAQVNSQSIDCRMANQRHEARNHPIYLTLTTVVLRIAH